MVKIMVGSTIDAIISEEKNNTGATSVLIGRSLSLHIYEYMITCYQNFYIFNTSYLDIYVFLFRSYAMKHAQWANQRNCTFSISQGIDEEIVVYNCKPSCDVPESSSRAQSVAYLAPRMSKRKKKASSHDEKNKLIICTLPNFEGIYRPSSSSSSLESSNESSQESEGFETIKVLEHEGGLLVELSWEVISEITNMFMNIIQFDKNEGFQMFSGRLEDELDIFVKRYVGTEYRYVLEAEKKAALTMYHKNILRLYGFHKNENVVALVFPFASKGALLNRVLNG